ncbi:MAG: hypothetical protein FJZ58_01845 [Chlamydiae bacterium]|nr:hypothetical protein [Chlamydiota bacterium]
MCRFLGAVPEKWKQEVQEYQASSLSQKDWCKQRGISPGGFCYRLKREREEATFFHVLGMDYTQENSF